MDIQDLKRAQFQRVHKPRRPTQKRQDLKEKIVKLENKWEIFKIEKEEITKSMMEAVLQNIDLHLAEHLQEMEEREKKKNIVIYNVPESQNQDPKERQSDDVARCLDIFQNTLKVRDFAVEKKHTFW